MKDIYYVYFVFSFIFIEKIAYSVGDCPEYCNATQCNPESDCPYGGCNKGFWGRRCQHPLECLLSGDNGVHYRGTKNVTKGGRSCIKWNAYHNFRKPPDGPEHNYCRHVEDDKTPNTWCYVSENGGDRWGNCEVPSCDNQCQAPNLQPHSVLTTKASNGFSVGLSITVKCDVGYVQQQDCKPLECLIPGDNGVHYRGTKNVTSDGTPCIKWNAVTYSYKPPDGPDHNYCRHAINHKTPNTWCYHSNIAVTRWGECNISLCDKEYLAAIDTVNCKKGFYRPHVSVECLQNRTWSKPFPACVDIQCSINTLPDYSEVNGTTNKTAFQVGEKIPIKCRTGYQLSGSNKIKCSNNGNWIPSNPCTDIDECIRTPCQRYATCINTQGSYNCTCEQGYYNDIPGHCSARCSKPSVNLHSSIVNGREVYKLNESLEVMCDEGYETSENRYFTCMEDTRWNGVLPTCKDILCNIPKLDHHSVLMNPLLNSTAAYNETITIHCEDGYSAEGKTTLTCLKDKTWDALPPKCKAICPEPTLQEHSALMKGSKTYKENDVLEIKCDVGYKTREETRFVCQNNKKWNGTMPRCTKNPKTPNEDDESSGPSVSALGGGIGAIVLVIIIIIVIIVVFRRRRNEQNEYKSMSANSPMVNLEMNLHSDSPLLTNEGENRSNAACANASQVNDDYYDFSPGQRPTKNAIKVDAIEEYVRRKVAEKETLEADYTTFKVGLQKSTDEANKSPNRKKNKYISIYPYDENRVTLKPLHRQPNTDYVNASYINGCGSFRKYIAAQGPIDPSVDDFWRMVWELNIKNIVMLTNVFEEEKKKCVQYWPDEGKLTFGDIDVILVKEDIFCDYTIRHLSLKMKGTSRTAMQYHFTAWPDKSVPKSGSALITIRNHVFGKDASQDIPTVVHCSAGIGRTGTFIALDFLIDQANLTGFVDFYECVATLRQQRVNMVQTKDQYVFLHALVVEALVYSQASVTSSDFAEKYKSLIYEDNFRTLFKTLQDTVPHIDEKEFKTGKAQENKRKNRFSNIIAVDSERPFLSADQDSNGYVNAVFLPSTRHHRAFIVTQMPLQETLTDFWKLIWEHDAQIIVMLNDTTDESCGTYWPSSEKCVLGRFAVTLKGTEQFKFGTASSFSLQYGKENRIVKQFKYALWSDKSTVPEESLPLLDLIKIVLSDKQNGPIVVHCLNGFEKSGVFCTLTNAVKTIEDGQEIDIPKIIRRLRLSRPQIIPNLEQFRFCYDAVMEYLNQFSTYQNI